MTFLHKSVGEDHLLFGSDLRDLRELHSISFEQVCRDTKMDAKILHALEDDRIDILDDPLFFRRHLQTYVRYLGGYEPYFLSRYDARLEALKKNTRGDCDILPRAPSVKAWDLFVAPQFLAFVGLIFCALLFGAYVFWQAHAVNSLPPLSITSPQDGERLVHPNVRVAGQTIPEATVTVNGHEAPVDESGAFSFSVDVRRGTTVITVVAKRRRGSESSANVRVMYDQEMLDSKSILDAMVSSTNVGASSTIEGSGEIRETRSERIDE